MFRSYIPEEKGRKPLVAAGCWYGTKFELLGYYRTIKSTDRAIYQLCDFRSLDGIINIRLLRGVTDIRSSFRVDRRLGSSSVE